MEMTIKGDAQEVAALILAIQEPQLQESQFLQNINNSLKELVALRRTEINRDFHEKHGGYITT